MADSKNYIEKEEMMEELKRSHELGKPTEELGKMFMELCEKYSHNYMFRDYERKYGKAFKQDLLSSGLLACSRAWNKFDMEQYDNPFSFFTTCIFRAYIGYLSKEYNYGNTKNALKVDVGMRGDYGYEEMMDNEQEKTDDEENSAFENVTVGYEKDEDAVTDEFGVNENVSKSEEPEPPKKDYKITNPRLEKMSLWGEDEEDEQEDETVNEIFGIGESK